MYKAWKIIPGKYPILLVASHNYSHLRKGKIKLGDIGTGAIVSKLCYKTKVWGFKTTKIQLDPNWYTLNPLRINLKEIIKEKGIKLVLDIHGRREKYPYLVELLPNSSFKNTVKETPKFFHTRDFADNNQLTLSEDLEKIGVPAAEIEIRKDGRVREGNKINYKLVIDGLSTLIDGLKNKLS